ncbi:hypothetical protein ACOMHN_029005 [Nucella lapillus]
MSDDDAAIRRQPTLSSAFRSSVGPSSGELPSTDTWEFHLSYVGSSRPYCSARCKISVTRTVERGFGWTVLPSGRDSSDPIRSPGNGRRIGFTEYT